MQSVLKPKATKTKKRRNTVRYEQKAMSIIQFQKANCKNCYKCIRTCPVKSIAFKNEQAEITEKECILCGHCFLACPQNAKQINSDLDKVKGYIKNGERVYASVAPSFASSYPEATFPTISAALKKLGFAGVEETSIGAAQVSRNFGELMKKHEMDNIITTCCPTVVLLVEKYYPDLIKYLAPVAAPMTAHGKMMKEVYGNRIKTVFIGPCISKMHEAADVTNSGAINAVLMFDELLTWIAQEQINLTEQDAEVREQKATINRLYPVPGGIIQTIDKDVRKSYKCIAIDGLDRCMEILDSMRDEKITNYFLEMNACAGSCLGGPGLKKVSYLHSKDATIQYVKTRTACEMPLTEDVKIPLHQRYNDRSIVGAVPSDEEIQQIFNRMGKTTEDKILNCGGCGYSTCRDKAIAVIKGKADIKMCLPYMREKAESISNVVMDNTPNAIIILDNEFNLLEFNTMAGDLFKLNEKNYIGRPISMIIDCDDMEEVQHTGENIYDRKVFYEDLDITVKQSTIFIKENSIYLLLIKNISENETQQKRMNEMREETIGVAQEVINKQMRVAQEIASLLGETTAETKLALTNLKKYIQESEDERIY